jgi:apolipoprotein N-acyltransferase
MGTKTDEEKKIRVPPFSSALLGLTGGIGYYLQLYPVYILAILFFLWRRRSKGEFFLFYSTLYWGGSIFLYHLEPSAFYASLLLFFFLFSPVLCAASRPQKYLFLGFSLVLTQTALWGFPWIRTAALLPHSFLLNYILPITGPLFLDLLLPLLEGKPVQVALLSLLLWVPYAGKTAPNPEKNPTRVTLLQNRYSTLTDWSKLNADRVFGEYLEMVSKEDSEVVLFPETSFPGAISNHPEIAGELEVLSRSRNVLVSTVHSEGGRIFNGIYLFKRGEYSPVYFKRRLVPYGEVVPFRGLVKFLNFPWGNKDFSRGEKEGVIDLNGEKVQLLLCYESVFPNLYSQKASATLVATNDSWFGDLHGMKEHSLLSIAISRSLKRPAYQSSTNGLTFAYTPPDELRTLPPFKKGSLTVPLRRGEASFYNEFRELPAWLLLTIIFCWCTSYEGHRGNKKHSHQDQRETD